MLIIKLLRYLRGYVSFRAENGFPERFLNLCRRYGIALWDLKSRGGVLTACTDCTSYKKLRTVAKKSGMKMRLSGKFGLPFFIGRHSFRLGVPIGMLTGLAILLVLSSRIWCIQVSGNTSIPAEVIVAAFEQLGVKQGASAAKIESSATEIEASKLMPELSWININIDGCKAYIEVREAVAKPETEDKEGRSNIVASRDGTIVELRPFSGTQEQKIGVAVLKGDLLISGIKENKDLSSSFCKASGYVVAQTNRNLETQIAKKFEAYRKTAVKKSAVLKFFGFSIPLGRQCEGGYKVEKHLRINRTDLPLGIVYKINESYGKTELNLSDSRAQRLAWAELLGNCADSFRGCEIKTITVSDSGGKLKAAVTCLENIAKEQPFEVEEGDITEKTASAE